MLRALLLLLVIGIEAFSMPMQRRQACRTAVAFGGALLAGSSFSRAAEANELGASVKLTIGQYLVDLREARFRLKPLIPLVQSGSSSSCKEFRVELRKDPLSGIRKACSKILLQLDEKSELRALKERQYEDIKKSLALVDDACRESVDRSKMDLVGMVTKLSDDIRAFEDGFGISVAP